MHDPEHLRRLNALLEEALSMPVSERAGWLAARPEGDRAVVPELSQLLARADVETDNFMRRPAAAALDALAAAEARPDEAGDVIGPYRLIEPLGEGGMATVWRAERADGGLAREVALKLPRLGFSAGLAHRMARERDLLAALEHPNVARLYDAGVSESGRPWLAMERVSGVPIDEYVRLHALGPAAVLRLVLQVCDALAHAHARLIVHRDLKPANLLVTEDSQVRLLDFGVGKLLQGEQDEGSAAGSQLTQMMGSAMTPDYASPEQIARRPLTVATDVYSLGVVLYELLSGQRPYRLGRQSAAALEEAILAADVQPASRRCADPARARQLRGDLDAVLARALAKSPSRRYASVESLAADLQAWLEGRPVIAKAPKWHYLAGKFVRRHLALVLGTTGVIVALSATLALVVVEQRRTKQQMRQALDQMARTDAVADLATFVLFDSSGRSETLSPAQLLERTARHAEQLQAPLQRAVALQFLATWHQQRGDPAGAERLIDAARRELPPEVERSVGPHLACLKANIASSAGRHDEARALVLQTLQRLGDNLDARTYCLLMKATVADRRPGGAEESEQSARMALALLEDSEVASTPFLRRRALLSANLAWSLSERGRWMEAEHMFQRSWALLVQGDASEGQHGASILANWAGLLLRAGRPAAAHERYQQAAEALRRRSPDRADHPVMLVQIAKALADLGHEEQAEQQFTAAVTRAEATGNKRIEAAARLGRGLSRLALGRRADAAGELQAAALLAPEVSRDLRGSTGVDRQVLEARLASADGRHDEAVSALQKALLIQEQAATADSVFRLPLVLALADVTLAAGRAEQARPLLERTLAVEQGRQPPGWPSARVGQLQLALGRAQRAAGDAHSAATLAAAARELEGATGADSPLTTQARSAAAGASVPLTSRP
jgi:eukaryotic-like serine/threonine-protein kinase